MIKALFLPFYIFFSLALSLHAAAPVVSNLSASQRAGTKLVDIVYDVSADTPTVEVSLEVSSNLGSSYITSATSFSGAIGADVAVGTGKTITWDAGADWNEQSSSYMRIKIIATEIDPPIPADMALIPAGSFQKGDRFSSYYGDTVETLHVNKFYAGKYEVTKSKWDEVRAWGRSNDRISTGNWYGIGDSTWNGTAFVQITEGQDPDHPVYGIHGLKMALWCNALSEMEGRTPCYTQDGEVYRVFEGIGSDMALVECDFTANGYRLPTQVEWEKAARGGLTGKLFPWGDMISHANANFNESNFSTRGYNTPGSEDIEDGQGRGYHDSFDHNFGAKPYLAPVGSFAANGYGLHDVVGNVQDMTWDCEVPRSSISKGFWGRGGDYSTTADYSILSSGKGNPNTVYYYGTVGEVVGFRVVISGDAPKSNWPVLSSSFTVNTISAKMPVLSLESYYESNSGESVTIDATPTDGYPTNYSYQWYFNGVAIQAASGGISNSYSIDGINSNDGTWKVEVTNDTGTTTAEFEYRALIETVPVLNIGAFYESNSGESITIDATPTDGYPTNFTYQWSFNNALISPSFGGASSTLLLTGSSFDNGTWKVQVTNDTGVTSAEFEYRVFADADGDGLSNYRESNLTNTNPDLEDSDSDGLNDYAEVITHNTDPNESDSDDDGLSDGAEITTHSSDPNDSDSDVDGLSDGAEVNTHSTDPKVSDSDGDGLSDGAEVNTHGTNPNASDSDADGLSDVDEITTHSTDPNLADSDSDGLVDGAEINTHSTDPLASDSSGDGLSDGYVVTAGFDPNTDYSALLSANAMNARGYYSSAQIVDARAGSVGIVRDGTTANLELQIQRSVDLETWTAHEDDQISVPMDMTGEQQFFRFAMPE